MTEAAESFTNVALVTNFSLNLLLSGAMSFLWGMLNCLQILAHFDLVNISMPANAHLLFKVLVQIATFDLLPAEDAISEIEDDLGIVNDDYAITESFVDFEFDSSGPIHNLQILFLVMLLLLMVPIILLFIKGIFFRSQKVTRSINKVFSKMFFNVYIRFGLEAYLELSLCSLIRFQNFTFVSSSETFHSVFAAVLLASIIAFLAFSLMFLQLRFAKLSH